MRIIVIDDRSLYVISPQELALEEFKYVERQKLLAEMEALSEREKVRNAAGVYGVWMFV